MATRLKSEDTITINGSQTIYGGRIFDMSMNIGYNSQPTSITILVFSKDGEYVISPDNINSSSIDTIKIGSKITITPCFLYSYKIIYQGDSRVLQLEYKDGSIILDKIYVSLHYTDSTVGFDNFSSTFNLPITCGPRNPLEVYNGTIHQYPSVAFTQLGSSALYSKPADLNNIWKGGFINIGFPEFSANACSIPNYKYTFYNLILSINNFGLAATKPPSINEFVSSDYRGTLRSVLDQWCSDYGFSFFWNSIKIEGLTQSNDDIIFVDMRNPVSIQAMEEIKNKIKSIQKTQKSVVTRYEESYSLQGTYKQYNISSLDIQGKNKTLETTNYYPIRLSNINPAILLSEVFKGNASNILAGRTFNQLITSSILKTYNHNLRDIYNWSIGAYKALGLYDYSFLLSSNTGNKDFEIGTGPSLSGILYTNINSSKGVSIEDLVKSNAQGAWSETNIAKQYKSSFYSTYPLTSGSPQFSGKAFTFNVLVGYKNEGALAKINAIEDFIGNNIGKFYRLGEQKLEEVSHCYDYKSTTITSSYNPDLTNVKSVNEIDVLKSLKLYGLNSGAINRSGDAIFYRNASYGTLNEDFNELISSEKGDQYLTGNQPTSKNIFDLLDPVSVGVGMQFDAEKYAQSILSGNGSSKEEHIISLNKQISVLMDNVKNKLHLPVTLMVGPSSGCLKDFFEVKNGSQKVINKIEKQNFLNENANTNSNNINEECDLLCANDYVDRFCEKEKDAAEEKQQYYKSQPYVGLESFYSDYIDVKILNEAGWYYQSNKNKQYYQPNIPKATTSNYTCRIVLPSYYDYLGYVSRSTKVSEWYGSQRYILGSFDKGAGDLENIKVTLYDMSSDVRPDNQGNSISTVFTSGDGYFYASVTDLHNMNDIALGEGVSEKLSTISVDLAGIEFGEITDYISPEKGLQGINLSFREDGAFVSLEFSNRPKVLERKENKFSKFDLIAPIAHYL